MPLVDGTCYIIAEAGSCHMGSKDAAFRLIAAAAHSGADACKFQLFRLPDILIDPAQGDPRTELPPSWVSDLAGLCREHRIDFLCTPFAPWAVEAIDPHVWAFKIGSFEHSRKDIHEAIVLTGKPVIASEGRGIVPIAAFGKNVPSDAQTFYELYCVSKYPAQPDDIVLPESNEFSTQKKALRWDGFSDHTTSTVIPALAVARGARIIEKHLRLPETTSECPDFPHSLEPWQFAEMVKNIRLAETVCWRQPPTFQEPSPLPNRRE